MKQSLYLHAKNQKETARISKNLAGPLAHQASQKGFVLALSAPLGGGKTSFTRFLLQEFGWQEAVPSPTYTLINTYKLAPFALTIYHLDAYRLTEDDADELLIHETLFMPGSLLITEWHTRLGDRIQPDLLCLIQSSGSFKSTARDLLFKAESLEGQKVLSELPSIKH